jgi:L-ascorbate metabolism protein UlaG (beta-lactamase superfamily)
MGDTDVFSDVGLIAEIHSPKIGLVPIGDRFTRRSRSSVSSNSIPCSLPLHYGTFDLLDQDASHFVAAMQGHPTKVVVPPAQARFWRFDDRALRLARTCANERCGEKAQTLLKRSCEHMNKEKRHGQFFV